MQKVSKNLELLKNLKILAKSSSIQKIQNFKQKINELLEKRRRSLMPSKNHHSPAHSDSRSDSLERSRSKKSKKSKKNKKEKKKKKSKKREKSPDEKRSATPVVVAQVQAQPAVEEEKEDNNGHDQGTPTIDEKPPTPTKMSPPKTESTINEKNGDEPKYTIDKTVYPYKPDYEP